MNGILKMGQALEQQNIAPKSDQAMEEPLAEPRVESLADPSQDERRADGEKIAVSEGLASPARRLQHYLDSELGSKFAEEVIEGKWSARRTFAFVMIVCGLFWAVVTLAVMSLI